MARNHRNRRQTSQALAAAALLVLCLLSSNLCAQQRGPSRPTSQQNPAWNAGAPPLQPVVPPTRTPITRSDAGPRDASSKKATKPNVPSGWMTFGALSFIVLLILGIAVLWRKHGPALPLGLPPEVIQVLGKRFVDQRQAIYLVRLGSKLLVLGSSPQGLQMLTEITDPVEVDLLAGLCQRRDAEQGVVQTFSQLFSRSRPPEKKASPRPAELYRTPATPDRFAMPAISSGGLDLEQMHD